MQELGHSRQSDELNSKPIFADIHKKSELIIPPPPPVKKVLLEEMSIYQSFSTPHLILPPIKYSHYEGYGEDAWPTEDPTETIYTQQQNTLKMTHGQFLASLKSVKPKFSNAEEEEAYKTEREKRKETARKVQAAIEADRSEMPDGLETRGWVRDVPIIAGILADDSEMQRRSEFPFFHTTDMGDLSEADALRDFQTKLIEIKAILNAKRAEYAGYSSNGDRIDRRIIEAGRLGDSLPFTGTPELQEAWSGFAAYWLKKIQSGKNLYIAITNNESSCFVYQNIVDELAKHDTEGKYLKNIHPFDTANVHLLDDHARKFMEEQCIIVADDWDITGGQIRSIIASLHGFKKDNMEINFVCATSKALAEGFQGVPVKGYFKRDSPSDDQFINPSIAGTHCSPDFGFAALLNEIYYDVRRVAGHGHYPIPALARAASLYKSYVREDILRHAAARRQLLLDQMAKYTATFAGVINKPPLG